MGCLKTLLESIEPVRVQRVNVGVFDTFVVSRFGGLASTARTPYPNPDSGVRNGGHLTELNLKELAYFALSDNPLEASIGMAAINSFFNDPNGGFIRMNGIELIEEKARGKKLAFIGRFPFSKRFLNVAEEVVIFEKHPLGDDIPASEIPQRLPEFDVIVITSMTLTNHTFEYTVSHARADAFKIMLGPTTPLSPVLFDYGIDALCGTVVTDIELVDKLVSEAVPFRNFAGIEYVALLKG